MFTMLQNMGQATRGLCRGWVTSVWGCHVWILSCVEQKVILAGVWKWGPVMGGGEEVHSHCTRVWSLKRDCEHFSLWNLLVYVVGSHGSVIMILLRDLKRSCVSLHCSWSILQPLSSKLILWCLTRKNCTWRCYLSSREAMNLGFSCR